MRIVYRLITACFVAVGSHGASFAQTHSMDTSAITRLAGSSSCATYSWARRGRAPRTYIQGVALVFARAVCHPERGDVAIASAAADVSPGTHDALGVYNEKFRKSGMPNVTAGIDTLRHSYVLLIGLGMMESSGRYCEGRDVSQCFAAPDTAEAGLFQTSYGARRHSEALNGLINRYNLDVRGCMMDVFKDSIECPIRRSRNPYCPNANSDVAGTGPGSDWQRLTKACPAFATEYGAVVLRTNGGAKGEFNPIRKREAEVRPACDAMLKQVQTYVEQHRDVCSLL